MNREQYLRTRIAEIAHELATQKLATAHKRNLEQALKFYIADLRDNQ